MTVSRVVIEHALDAIASDEGGMRFQGLAVVLAKLRWPELIACERKKDLGLDAHAPAILSPLHKGMGLSSSITPELEKIQGDAARAKPHFSDLQILVFVTSGKVTNYTVEQWQADIKKEYGWDLIVMSREEIISTLQVPGNVGLCAEHLGIAVPLPEPTVEALIQSALAANGEIITNWSRKAQRPRRCNKGPDCTTCSREAIESYSRHLPVGESPPPLSSWPANTMPRANSPS
jgi:hypothetical protein